MSDFGFCSDAYTAPSRTQDDQELINWFVENDPRKTDESAMGPSERGNLTLYPTPGLTTQCQLKAGEVRGLKVLTGGNQFCAVAADAVYLVDAAFIATQIGTLLSTTGPVSIEDNGIELYLVDGANRYGYTKSTNAFTTIASSDGPFAGGTVVGLVDNYFVYNDPNSNQYAASDALSIVTQPLSLGSKFGYSDNIVSLVCDHREIWLLGEQYSEVHVDVGAFPFPFQIVPGTSMQHGCAAPFSVSRLGDSFAFVSQDSRGNSIAVQMNGYQAQRISTSSVEYDLQGDYIADCRAYTYQVRGHELYVMIFPTANKTWVYDSSTNMWHKWLSWDGTQYNRHRSNCYCFFQGQGIVGDYSNGKLYSLEPSVYTEDGSVIRRLRRCPHLVNDFRRVFHRDLQLQFQPGVGLSSGQGQDPQAMLRWSNDGGFTWSTEHWASIGKQGNYKNRALWRRLGWARDRIYEVVITDPVNAVIVSANLSVDSGAT